MKLYIESYQSKIEELEPFETKCQELAKDYERMKEASSRVGQELENLKIVFKEKNAEWKLKEQELLNHINKNQSKQQMLEGKVKDLESILKTNRTQSELTEQQLKSSNFTNNLEAKKVKPELILFKDESCKMSKQSKIKYLLNGLPGGSVRAGDEPDDGLISFSELSTKVPDKSKSGSNKKKVNPYKIEYFKNQPGVSESVE
jgi:hypothetical protein